MSTFRRLKIEPCTKLKSKWIKDLNINSVTLNLLEEKVGSISKCIDTGDYFLNITPAVQKLRAIIYKWDLLKLESFCKAKNMVNKIKQLSTEWEKHFTNPTSDRGLISKIYKEFKKLDIKIPNNF